ncbi:M23 family metallopeptidase [Pseudoclavibacter sp. 13-3]|uniref:M23 family metallopeptidase n=1 Tax=Pseudoclavibacter sp. 13-3 TaxID=2901228 RepID=UPI001E553EC8|nr:M23 family metallopeptidase [Pseudoclavibacter sp. 13-3]MCD7101784.1 M23 family metallopeptidase [Pseudoclavibacter sp. 13-3]
MPRRRQLPGGAVLRQGRRSFSRPLKTGHARNITAVAIAMGLSFTAAVPAYAVSPAVAATSDLTQLTPAEIAYREAELVDSGTLQSGALLASSASYASADGGDFLTAEQRASARLGLGTCESLTGVAGDASAVVPVPAGSYTVTSRIAERWGRMHNGVDFAAPLGTPILAAWSGTVIEVGSAGGNPMVHLRTKLSDGTQVDHFYLHMPLSSVTVSAGDQVAAGQVIAQVGNEGHSTGAHLHFEVHLNGGANVSPTVTSDSTVTDGLDLLQQEGAVILSGSCGRS